MVKDDTSNILYKQSAYSVSTIKEIISNILLQIAPLSKGIHTILQNLTR